VARRGAAIWFCEAIVGLVGASEEQAAITSVLATARAAWPKCRRLDIEGASCHGDAGANSRRGIGPERRHSDGDQGPAYSYNGITG
jgi:hypothetical protein